MNFTFPYLKLSISFPLKPPAILVYVGDWKNDRVSCALDNAYKIKESKVFSDNGMGLALSKNNLGENGCLVKSDQY